jgi:hypothetical protein
VALLLKSTAVDNAVIASAAAEARVDVALCSLKLKKDFFTLEVR